MTARNPAPLKGSWLWAVTSAETASGLSRGLGGRGESESSSCPAPQPVTRELRISRTLIVVDAKGFWLLILMESLGSTFERGENPRTDAAHTRIKDADLACVAAR